MKLIPLTQNFFAKVDDTDYPLVSQHRWYYNSGYAKTYHNGKRFTMHRLIMNFPKGKMDHRNRDKLDNRRANLRVCTTQQNNRNISMRKDNTSGYKGVFLDKSTGHWRPVVYVNGKSMTFGQYADKQHAALAYDLWATFFHGEYASTNFTVVSQG
jgi:HNH endonuclease